MSKGMRFTGGFKQGAVAQVVERGYAVSEVVERLGSLPNRCKRGRHSFRSQPVLATRS